MIISSTELDPTLFIDLYARILAARHTAAPLGRLDGRSGREKEDQLPSAMVQ